MSKESKIRMGAFVRVDNKDRQLAACKYYYALKIEDNGGDNERWLLFTEREKCALRSVGMNTYAKVKPGRIMAELATSRTAVYFIPVIDEHDNISVLQFPKSVVKLASERAVANPEDIPKMSFLQDLLD